MTNSSNSSSVESIDNLIYEYLVFRGFNQTINSYTNERGSDKSMAFRPERIVERLFQHIHNFEIGEMIKFWKYLELQFFSKLPNSYKTVKKLETSLKRYYVVYCIQKGKNDRCIEFFSNYATELVKSDGEDEWHEWFQLPFLKQSVVMKPKMQPFFDKQWVEMLSISLQNFISTALLSTERPKLMTLEHDTRVQVRKLEKRIEYLKKENELLRKKWETEGKT